MITWSTFRYSKRKHVCLRSSRSWMTSLKKKEQQLRLFRLGLVKCASTWNGTTNHVGTAESLVLPTQPAAGVLCLLESQLKDGEFLSNCQTILALSGSLHSNNQQQLFWITYKSLNCLRWKKVSWMNWEMLIAFSSIECRLLLRGTKMVG